MAALNSFRTFWQKFFVVRPKPELKEFYWFSALFSFATALVLIFEPVFFYQAGFSLSQIAIYYGLHYTLYFLLLPLGGKFAARFGLERALTLSLPLFMGYFLILSAVSSVPDLFWVAWAVLALFKIFYWPAYYAEYSQFGDDVNQGTEVSLGLVITLGVGVLGPLVGGVIAARFGFPILFVTVAAVGLAAAIPLLRTREKYHVRAFDYLSAWRVIASRQHRRMVVATIGWAEELVHYVFWPVFAFSVLGALDVLGFVASISVLVMSLLAFFVGEWSDRARPRAVLRRMVPLMSLVYLLRFLTTSVGQVFIVHALALSADVGVKIPFTGKIYSQARRQGALTYVVSFEIVLAIVKASMAFFLAAVFALGGAEIGFAAAFLGAAILALFYLRL